MIIPEILKRRWIMNDLLPKDKVIMYDCSKLTLVDVVNPETKKIVRSYVKIEK